MFLLFRGGSAHLFVAATLALPNGENRVGIAGALIDGAIGRNDLAATDRAHTTSRGSLLNIEGEHVLFRHVASLNLSLLHSLDVSSARQRSNRRSSLEAAAARALPG